MAINNYLPLEFRHFAADKEREQKFSAVQIGVWNVELRPAQEPREHGLFADQRPAVLRLVCRREQQ
jgi:hypothetical protein